MTPNAITRVTEAKQTWPSHPLDERKSGPAPPPGSRNDHRIRALELEDPTREELGEFRDRLARKSRPDRHRMGPFRHGGQEGGGHGVAIAPARQSRSLRPDRVLGL